MNREITHQESMPSTPTTGPRDHREKRGGSVSEWIWEILLIVTVTPAAVYGVASLNNLPVA